MGKRGGGLSRAGKVRGQTPKIEPQNLPKKATGRAKTRRRYNMIRDTQHLRSEHRARATLAAAVESPTGVHEGKLHIVTSDKANRTRRYDLIPTGVRSVLVQEPRSHHQKVKRGVEDRAIQAEIRADILDQFCAV